MREYLASLTTGLPLSKSEAWPPPLFDVTPTFEDKVSDALFELQTVLVGKHHDYGPGNINASPGGALNGLVVRMHDKLARIVHLSETEDLPSNEPLRDSFIDLANYAVIGLMVLDGTWPE